ncbi:MAG: hypothetical protein ACJAWL_003744 [Motiliproteus sp.]|jgi:hypothetical protein
MLSQLAHHVHPAVVERIQQRNEEERAFFESLFENKIPVSSYLFSGSACVFPGVKRYVSGQGVKRRYNRAFSAIIDDNVYPRHLWCYMAGSVAYSGPSWKNLRLSTFELAHVFSHKETELEGESRIFETYDNAMLPFGDFTCACNVVLLPKGTVRPTDNSDALKAVFYQRYIDLYGETPLQGRSGFRKELVPAWYRQLKWNEPVLPSDWKSKTDKLLSYRTKKIARAMERDEI